MTTLTQVHQASEPHALHVVFIHGLNGDALSTWMENPKDQTTLWPCWVGEEVGCNVWVAEYGAAVSGWTDSAMHLSGLGEALFSALQVEKALQNCRIVLVGHSLGGLVIKTGMTQAQALGDPPRVALLARIVGVVFVGTPHQGSSLATVADRLRLPLRTNALVTNMVSGDAWLRQLKRQFQTLQRIRDFDVRVFFESKPTLIIGCRVFGLAIGWSALIVDENSSDPAIEGVTPTGIEEDHYEIAKPKSREALIHKALVDFLRGVASSQQDTPSNTDKRSSTPWASSPDLPNTLQNASAPLLSWPSTLSDGTWLDRPELGSLIERLVAESSGTYFLLGDPGCGKSSLLVRLAEERREAGWCVLGIKADRLPPEVLDRKALAKHLNLEEDTAASLRSLACTVPVLVLIDQVDALADLVVQQSARLRVLLDLVQDLSEAPGVHTVISCRIFEQKYDPALRVLEATVIRLEPPEWSIVQSVLKKRGLQVDLWNQDIKEVLRSPHALEIFLSLLGAATEPEVLRSFHGLLEKQWEMRVLSDTTGRRRITLRHLAKLMAEREVLGLPLVQVEDYYKDIQGLEAAGLLRLDQGPGRVEFRHQTLYEFVRARSFLEDSGSLTEAVRTQQDSLRIRPQIWHALAYFRSASPEEYGTEIGRLWAADLRPHLKILLIEFLGLQTRPTFVEVQLVERAMTDHWFLPRFIGAAVGSPGWFAALLPTHLPRLMASPKEQAQALLPILRQALHFSAAAVVDLVRRHWLSDPDRDVLSWQTIGGGEVAPQPGMWLDSLVLIAGRSLIGEQDIGYAAGVVSAAQPEEAPRLIAAWLRFQITAATAPLNKAPPGDETAYAVMVKKVQAALEARQFYNIEGTAEAAPRAFVKAMWPLLLEGLQHFASDSPSVVIAYQGNIGMIFQEFGDEEVAYERPLLRAFQLGIQGWADSDADDFLEFVTANAQSEILLVHRLLALGLVRIAARAPQRVFDYLRGDSRRLVLGSSTDVHKESLAMIAAVCSWLDDTSYAEMESILRNWRYYDETVQKGDVVTKRHRQQWARRHRLRLLRALPYERRSAALQRFVDEEERAFPSMTDKNVHSSGNWIIGSPLSVEQMDRATDADILNFFSELTDDSRWDHPRHQTKGGAIQAGRALAELAKRDLAKVLRIVRLLDPICNEIPVSSTLSKLVPAGLVTSLFYSLVAELEDKGFEGAGFRRNAAWAVANAASKETPVPDELIDRMERWLIPCTIEDASEVYADVKETSSPVLWGHGALELVPNGNYPVLRALTSACLSAEPPRFDRWLSILERHAARAESSRVWETLIQHERTNLGLANPAKVEALVDQVIVAAPSILAGRGLANFVAHAFRWASVAAVRRWMMAISKRAGAGRQGAGELACLRHALFPAEDWSRELVTALIGDTASDASLGVAYAVANLWHEPMTRPVVHPFLLMLLRSEDERVLTALSAIFTNDGFTADAETKELLDTLVDYPIVLKNGRAEHLPEILANLVSSEPDLVCRVAHALLDAAGDQMGNIATSWYLHTASLLDIALKLQDMGTNERAAGAALFERMLEFNMPQAKAMTLDLDKRTPVGSNPQAPFRRWPQRKTRKRT